VVESEAGVAILVWRKGERGMEVLLLHRSLFPPDYAGDWAWSTPGGARDDDENPLAAATRELREETGLTLRIEPVTSEIAASLREVDVHVFAAEAATDEEIALSSEHDRYEWVTPADLSRCRPGWVNAMYAEFLAQVRTEGGSQGT
jgi:8-oxo-dGTP diphosphatase